MNYTFHFIVILLCPFIIFLFLIKNEGMRNNGMRNKTNDYRGPIPGYYGPFTGYDYEGSDIKHVPNATVEQCQHVCNYTQGCVGVISSAEKDCWLKSNFTNKTPKENRNVYYNNNFMRYIGPLEDYDYKHNDIKHHHVISLNDCQMECSTLPNCIGIMTSGEQCWLKSAFDKKKRKFKPGFKSYTKYF